MSRTPVITVSRRIGPTAGLVLQEVVAARRLSRDDITARTGLSSATVSRTVTRLAELRLLRERPDLIQHGAIGRPGVPIEVDGDHYVTIGIHIGRRIATVAIGDLAGRVLCHEAVQREAGTAPDLTELSRLAARLLGRTPDRVPIATGVVAPWRDLGLHPGETATSVGELTGLRVQAADHVTAVAAAEYRHRRKGVEGMTLYVYARDTIGWTVAAERHRGIDVNRAVSLNHYPTSSPATCDCGRTGCLAATAGDEAVVGEAVAAGLIREPSIDALYRAFDQPAVRALLTRRARLLGEVAGSVRDMVAPDRVVLVGQAFTWSAALLPEITAAYSAVSTTGEIPVSFTRFGAGIQAISACTVALGPVLDDPIEAVAPTTPSARKGA